MALWYVYWRIQACIAQCLLSLLSATLSNALGARRHSQATWVMTGRPGRWAIAASLELTLTCHDSGTRWHVYDACELLKSYSGPALDILVDQVSSNLSNEWWMPGSESQLLSINYLIPREQLTTFWVLDSSSQTIWRKLAQCLANRWLRACNPAMITATSSSQHSLKITSNTMQNIWSSFKRFQTAPSQLLVVSSVEHEPKSYC